MTSAHNYFTGYNENNGENQYGLYLYTVYKYYQFKIICLVSHITVTVHYLYSHSVDHCNVAHLDAVKMCVHSPYLYFLPVMRSKDRSSVTSRQALLVHELTDSSSDIQNGDD